MNSASLIFMILHVITVIISYVFHSNTNNSFHLSFRSFPEEDPFCYYLNLPAPLSVYFLHHTLFYQVSHASQWKETRQRNFTA